MKFEVTILGSNSAFPSQGRFPSSQVVYHNDDLYLIDCGEGTQIRMSDFSIKRSRIEHIFISHLHGDHVFGLPGLINSYHHFGRVNPLHIYGPTGIRSLIEAVLRMTYSMVEFEIIFHEIQTDTKQKVFDSKHLRVYTFPILHRVPTYGYLFQEKISGLNLRKEAILEHNLTIDQIRLAKEGQPVSLQNGTVLSTGDVTLPPRTPRSYAYCSDTAFDKRIVDWIENVSMLYHEATFLHELEQKAIESKHSTALQAGMIAHMANAGRLLIGHFSSRYDDLNPLLLEAGAIFSSVEIAREGHTYAIE